MTRFLLLCLATLGLFSTAMSAAEKFFPVHALGGGSFIVPAAEAKDVPTPNGARAEFVEQPTGTLARLQVHRTTLLPGRSPHGSHRHQREEMMILLDGELEALQETTKTHVGTGSVLFQASNDLHGVTNVGAKPAIYLVLNFYLAEADYPKEAPADALPSMACDWNRLEVKTADGVERRPLLDAKTRTLTRLAMHAETISAGNKGLSSPQADEQFFVVKEGEIAIELAGASHVARRGDLVFIGAQQSFSWHVAGSGGVTLYRVTIRPAPRA